MLRTSPAFRSWVERVAQSYLWPFFPCSINYSWDQVQKLFWHTRTFRIRCWKIYSHKNLPILLDKGFFCPHILLSKSFSHLLLGQNNLLAGTFHSWIKLSPELKKLRVRGSQQNQQQNSHWFPCELNRASPDSGEIFRGVTMVSLLRPFKSELFLVKEQSEYLSL